MYATGGKMSEISASRGSYTISITMYPTIATPVSNTSVVNLRIPSAQSPTSLIALVSRFPEPSFASSGPDLCVRLA